MRTFVALLAGAAALFLVPAAAAKEFGPGDIRVCNGKRCVPIVEQEVLPSLTSLYYSGPPLAHVRRPAFGAPYFELRFPNGYVTGIVAARALDRFLSYGVHLERFARGTWYAVPRRLAQELRRLTMGMRPLRVDRAALARSR